MKKRQMNYENDRELTAKRLREAMDDMNITAAELSEKSKVHKASISQYLHSVQSPSNISASSLAKILNVNPMWLMGFDVPKTENKYISNIVFNPTEEETIILEKYRCLSKEDKDSIISSINRLYTYSMKMAELRRKDGDSDETSK